MTCYCFFLTMILGCNDPIEGAMHQENGVYDGEKISSHIDNGPISSDVNVYPKNPKLGDPITLEFVVLADPSFKVDMPPFGEALGRFQIVSFKPHEQNTDDNKIRYQQTYTLQAPMSGRQMLPPLRVTYVDSNKSEEEKEILTDTLTIEIESLLDEDAPLTLSEPKGELILNRDVAALLIPISAIVTAVLLGILAFWYVRRYQQKAIVKNAYFDALQSLMKLEHEDFEGRWDEFYAKLSLIVRRYISDRFGLKAVERTTEEFLSMTELAKLFTEEQRFYLRDLLQMCDMMKFTKEKQSATDHQSHIQRLRTFLEATTPMEDRVS